jgi:O-acetyl-ADP-ribose deacetylase (regulator of RNase III)
MMPRFSPPTAMGFPLIGAGTGGFPPARVLAIMRDEAERNPYDDDVRIVQFNG